jgi:hypothetical protein
MLAGREFNVRVSALEDGVTIEVIRRETFLGLEQVSFSNIMTGKSDDVTFPPVYPDAGVFACLYHFDSVGHVQTHVAVDA